jgi:hypothetical protein
MKTHHKNVKSGLQMMLKSPILKESSGKLFAGFLTSAPHLLPRSSIWLTYNGRPKKAAALLLSRFLGGQSGEGKLLAGLSAEWLAKQSTKT